MAQPAGGYRIVELRRFPVKAMSGESLTSVELEPRGFRGDRWYAVEDDAGHFASGKNTNRFRRHDAVFDYRAETRPDGTVEVIGRGGSWRVGHDALDDELSRVFGTAVRVTAEAQVSHFDAAPVSIIGTASLQWCAREFGIEADARRLRANVLIETDEPFVEETWAGHRVQAGTAVLRVSRTAERCRMIDIAHDDVTPHDRWLKPLGEHRDLQLAVYAEVLQAGRLDASDRLWPLG